MAYSQIPYGVYETSVRATHASVRSRLRRHLSCLSVVEVSTEVGLDGMMRIAELNVDKVKSNTTPDTW